MRAKLHHHANFRRNRSNRGRDMAIFQFSKTAAAAFLDFQNFKFFNGRMAQEVELFRRVKIWSKSIKTLAAVGHLGFVV